MPLSFSQFYSSSPGQPAPYMAQQQAQAAIAEQQRIAAWIQNNPQRAQALGIAESDWDRQVRERKEREQQMRERAEQIKQDYELTTSLAEKKRLSRLQNGFNAAVNSGIFDSSEIDVIKKQVMIEAMDLPKTLVEKTQQQKQMDALREKGMEIGVPFQWEDGNTYTMEFDASGNLKQKLQLRFDQSRAYQEMELQDRFTKYIGDQRLKMMSERNPDGTPTYSTEGIESLLEGAYPQYRQQKEMQRQQEQAMQQQLESIPWWQKAQSAGVEVIPSDISLPEDTGQAQVILRALWKKYNGTAPPAGTEDYLRFIHASKLLRAYESERLQPAPSKTFKKQKAKITPGHIQSRFSPLDTTEVIF